MLEFLIPTLAISTLTGFIGGQKTPRDEVTAQILRQLDSILPYFNRNIKGEVTSLVDAYKSNIDKSLALAKTQAGTTLAEAFGSLGVPSGQPSASMYVSEMAPLEAKALESKSQIDMWGAEYLKSYEMQQLQGLLNLLGIKSQLSSQAPDMTPMQAGLLSALSGFRLATSGAGNLYDIFLKAFSEENNLNKNNKSNKSNKPNIYDWEVG